VTLLWTAAVDRGTWCGRLAELRVMGGGRETRRWTEIWGRARRNGLRDQSPLLSSRSRSGCNPEVELGWYSDFELNRRWGRQGTPRRKCRTGGTARRPPESCTDVYPVPVDLNGRSFTIRDGMRRSGRPSRIQGRYSTRSICLPSTVSLSPFHTSYWITLHHQYNHIETRLITFALRTILPSSSLLLD
jgi:hypothetical protein